MHMPPATLLMPAWTPLAEAPALPRLWPGFAAVVRLLGGRTWTLAGQGPAATLSAAPKAPPDWREAIALRLRWRGHDGELALDAVAQAWCLGDEVPGDAPLAWRQVLLADALQGGAKALLGHVPEWEPAAAPWPRDANALWCAIAPASSRPEGHARLRWASAEAWAAFAEAVRRHPPLPQEAPVARRQRLSACLVPLRLELGRTRLALASLRQIAPGDIVAVDEWRPRGPAIGVQLYAGRRGELQWPAEVRQTRLTVLPATEPAMSTAPTSAAPPAMPALKAERVDDDALPVDKLEKLEVVLNFDLGGLALSLHALEQLAAGHVLELPHPLNQCELSILCQQRVLGKGQLVAVGERLGVRVTEFAAGAHAAPA
ncbi:FliM/FliN family flagellar motor switch protein [Ideonella sp. YS5]|uniref:FliM/FliN family flagellar motor switch protein n=1 Tax=Ideonella sp. YS5 TaxID=3453714 RepID=UPI003EED9643